jgi:hypothetical protein
MEASCKIAGVGSNEFQDVDLRLGILRQALQFLRWPTSQSSIVCVRSGFAKTGQKISDPNRHQQTFISEISAFYCHKTSLFVLWNDIKIRVYHYILESCNSDDIDVTPLSWGTSKSTLVARNTLRRLWISTPVAIRCRWGSLRTKRQSRR